MIIKDHWYIACPSSQLGADAPRAVQVGETLLVAFRSSDGQAHVLLDRCCHRGVRLSRGRICGDHIACGYHGWEYDASGKLVMIPSLGPGAAAPSHSVPSFPVAEKDHYVWVWMAGEHLEPTYQPEIRGLRNGLWIQQSCIWETAVMPAVENQLDVAHTAFAHPGIYPGHKSAAGELPPLRTLEFECRADANSVSVFSPPRADASEPAPTLEYPTGIGLFELPYRNYVFLPADETRAIYNWVPLAANRCRLEFMGFSARGGGAAIEADERRVIFLEDELELLSQDRHLLESAQHWLDQDQGAYERSVRADAAPLMARRLVERTLRGGPASKAPESEERRLFTCTA